MKKMKNVKFALMAAASFIGLASAFAGTQRLTFTYTNQAQNGTYVKVADFLPAKCNTSSIVRPCSYQSTVDLGPSASETDLTTVSAIPSANAVYVP